LSLFLPTIIKGLGYSAALAQLLTIPVYAAATISCILVGYFSDRTGQRSFFTFACYAAVFVGFLIAVAPASFIPGLTYAGCFIAACGMYPAIPGLLTLSSNNWAPDAKRAVGIAIQIGFGTMAGAAASNFYRSEDAPRYRLGHALVLTFAALGLFAMILYYIICRRINSKRDSEAERVTRLTSEELVDLGDKAPSFRYAL
jgi:MFS family permease